MFSENITEKSDDLIEDLDTTKKLRFVLKKINGSMYYLEASSEINSKLKTIRIINNQFSKCFALLDQLEQETLEGVQHD